MALLIEYATLQGWRVTHFRPAWTSRGWRTPVHGDKGFPDIVCVRPPRIEFIECKTTSGRLSPEQTFWVKALTGCEAKNPFVGVRVWTPENWPTAQYVLR